MRTRAWNSLVSAPPSARTVTVRGTLPSFIAAMPVIVNVSSPDRPSDSAFSPSAN